MARKYSGCKVEGCNSPHKGLGYCARHYIQMKKHGKVILQHYDVNKPNETIDYGDTVGIILRDRYGNLTGEAIVDKERACEIVKYKWHKTKKGHAARRCTEKPGLFFMHWHIVERRKDMVVDHINGDPLDNRIVNLRVCTNQENIFNSKVSKNNTSGVHGVSFHKPTKMWRAYINLDRKQIHLGMFDNIEDAKESRLKAEMKYHKEFSASISRKKRPAHETTIFNPPPR